ncbi:2OG-Fe(II) oxygenase family protein [Pseudoalteromonas umbrosa]|uniref:2OG-Fe(II) oxygenase family protein n=1 Tax=Pseudoalteromonas umbrosa TaxID=3048489 RepID=UPI0024C36A13|nr:2OG-Fe(II) oxygenase family protein [Pseudoalteromonas sp. B95]MDK1288221.1 2OG-Fe(II) oxygenase family protein [Pseudoalteromonas sp. B95]
MIMPNIPTFSLEELKDGSRQKELAECVTQIGLFYVSDYGCRDSLHRNVTDMAIDFFEKSRQEEQAAVSLEQGSNRRGFSGLGTESTASSTGVGHYSDYAFCYSMGTSNNLFPSDEFETVWSGYFDKLYSASRDIAKSVLISVEESLNGIDDIDEFLTCEPLLRVRYFPEVPKQRSAENMPSRMAPHYDLSVITLIQQFSCPNGFVSLQAKIGDKTIALPEKPGTVVILCGAVASLVTRGRIHAPIHHVAAPPTDRIEGSDRSSAVMFLRPNANFRFSVPDAKKCGLDVSIESETATFADWMGGNYVEMLSVEETV